LIPATSVISQLRDHLLSQTVAEVLQAIQYFEQAAEKDPRNARAYAGLADAYALVGGCSLRPQTEFMDKARAAAVRALETDPSLAEAHTALALIIQNYDWDWTTAETEFRRAIELNPNYATAHHWYAEHLMWRGRFEEALRESERARQLDPLSVIIAADNGVILYCSRQYNRAVEKFRAAREMEPGFPRAEVSIAPYVEKGLFAEALADLAAERSKLDLRTYWASKAYKWKGGPPRGSAACATDVPTTDEKPAGGRRSFRLGISRCRR
jgi:Tfp pilus assembly protein PilF